MTTATIIPSFRMTTGEGAVAVGIPQDDEPVLRDDNFILRE
jgi:hypothetical protein